MNGKEIPACTRGLAGPGGSAIVCFYYYPALSNRVPSLGILRKVHGFKPEIPQRKLLPPSRSSISRFKDAASAESIPGLGDQWKG
jgi:hypothetical protein